MTAVPVSQGGHGPKRWLGKQQRAGGTQGDTATASSSKIKTEIKGSNRSGGARGAGEQIKASIPGNSRKFQESRACCDCSAELLSLRFPKPFPGVFSTLGRPRCVSWRNSADKNSCSVVQYSCGHRASVALPGTQTAELGEGDFWRSQAQVHVANLKNLSRIFPSLCPIK